MAGDGVRTRYRRADLVLTSFALGIPIFLYNLVLAERLTSALLEAGGFMVAERLTAAGKVVYLLVFGAAIGVFLLTAAVLVRGALRRLARWAGRSGRGFTRTGVILVGTAYLVVVSARFRVFEFLSTRIDLALVRLLGEGDLSTSVDFVRQELAAQLPLVLGSGLGLAVGALLLRLYGGRAVHWLEHAAWARPLLAPQALLAANVAVVAAPLFLVQLAPPVHEALRQNLAYAAYLQPAKFLSDVDRDGYSLLTRPTDHAPFDGSRHPYALDIAGNSIDENGLGGDLPEVEPVAGPEPPWDPARLRGDNVLLVVIDSLRHDILRQEVNGEPVMPFLRREPGSELVVVSHAAHSTAALSAYMSGTFYPRAPGHSLIDRFNELGYATGVFSGQDERSGNTPAKLALARADRYVDAVSMPDELRMHAGTNPAALAMPLPLVAERFRDWVAELEPGRPFFAYVNVQEAHFPYHYDGMPLPLVERPIPRSEIAPTNREWLFSTYMNAVRVADEGVGLLAQILRDRGFYEDTVVLVVGDHGEELFDYGHLGHGIRLNLWQYATAAKLLHSPWSPPEHPIGQSAVPTVLHNALLKDAESARPLDDSTQSWVGTIDAPHELGKIDRRGLVKYDFLNSRWLRERWDRTGIEPVEPRLAIVRRWESRLLADPRPQD